MAASYPQDRIWRLCDPAAAAHSQDKTLSLVSTPWEREAAMTPNEITAIRSQLLVVGVHGTKVQLHRRCKAREIVRLLSGIYVPTAALADLGVQQRRDVVFAARLSALSIRLPSHVLSGAATAPLLGLPGEGRLEELIAYAPTRGCSRIVHFPSLTLPGDQHIPGVTLRTCRPCQPAASVEFLGFRIAAPSRILVDCARTCCDEQAFVLACAGLARASHFNRFRPSESRARLAEARRDLLAEASLLPVNTPGRRRAEWIARNANAGCESPGEALVLLALLRAGISGLTTQEEVHCRDNTYFIDIALPALKIAIEFDGRAKYGNTVEEVHDSVEAQQRRQRRLEVEGWLVIRIRWSDLRHMDEVVAQIRVAIRSRSGR